MHRLLEGPAEPRAVALACPGLAPFVVAALRKLGDICARFPAARARSVKCPEFGRAV